MGDDAIFIHSCTFAVQNKQGGINVTAAPSPKVEQDGIVFSKAAGRWRSEDGGRRLRMFLDQLEEVILLSLLSFSSKMTVSRLSGGCGCSSTSSPGAR